MNIPKTVHFFQARKGFLKRPKHLQENGTRQQLKKTKQKENKVSCISN